MGCPNCQHISPAFFAYIPAAVCGVPPLHRPPNNRFAITYGNLLLNCDSYAATVDGSDFELTQKEFEILRELLTHQGRILTRQNLLDKLWRFDFYGDERVVDTHIKNLRKKLGIDFIQTIRGVGYKVDKEN